MIIAVVSTAFTLGMLLGLSFAGNSPEKPEGHRAQEAGPRPSDQVPPIAAVEEPSITREEIVLMEGTPFQTVAYIIRAHDLDRSPALLVLGGVHGDEDAGYLSAERLAGARVSKGTLIVVPRANEYAIRAHTRAGTMDLNRAFPGTPAGTAEDRLAYEIFNLIQNERPDLVLTTHVAPGYYLENPAYYGQTIIFDYESTRSLADRAVERINPGIAVAVERYSVLVEPIPTSATYEIYGRLGITSYGIETSAKMGITKCSYYHLRVIEIFCDLIGLRIENWPEIIPTIGE